MVWSSSPTRKTSRVSPASSSASSSCVRSRSCDSSTRSTARPPTPQRERRSVLAEDPQRARHEVVEVEQRLGGERGAVCGVGRVEMHLVRWAGRARGRASGA